MFYGGKRGQESATRFSRARRLAYEKDVRGRGRSHSVYSASYLCSETCPYSVAPFPASSVQLTTTLKAPPPRFFFQSRWLGINPNLHNFWMRSIYFHWRLLICALNKVKKYTFETKLPPGCAGFKCRGTTRNSKTLFSLAGKSSRNVRLLPLYFTYFNLSLSVPYENNIRLQGVGTQINYGIYTVLIKIYFAGYRLGCKQEGRHCKRKLSFTNPFYTKNRPSPFYRVCCVQSPKLWIWCGELPWISLLGSYQVSRQITASQLRHMQNKNA